MLNWWRTRGAVPFGVDDPAPFVMKKRGKETDYELLLAVVVVVGIGAPLWWRYIKETAPAQ
jgi:hypothetical protein